MKKEIPLWQIGSDQLDKIRKLPKTEQETIDNRILYAESYAMYYEGLIIIEGWGNGYYGNQRDDYKEIRDTIIINEFTDDLMDTDEELFELAANLYKNEVSKQNFRVWLTEHFKGDVTPNQIMKWSYPNPKPQIKEIVSLCLGG